MTRSDAHGFGRRSLRIDALFCVVAGLALAIGADLVAQGVALPSPVVVAAGIVVVVWGLAVVWLPSRLGLRPALRFVMAVNVVAALAVAILTVLASGVWAALAIIAVALIVALFAVSQSIAVGRMRAAAAP